MPKNDKNGKEGGTFLSKTPFFEPVFTFFFKKTELFRRKIVQINIFPGPGGITKSANTKKGQAYFAKKWVKKGNGLGKLYF